MLNKFIQRARKNKWKWTNASITHKHHMFKSRKNQAYCNDNRDKPFQKKKPNSSSNTTVFGWSHLKNLLSSSSSSFFFICCYNQCSSEYYLLYFILWESRSAKWNVCVEIINEKAFIRNIKKGALKWNLWALSYYDQQKKEKRNIKKALLPFLHSLTHSLSQPLKWKIRFYSWLIARSSHFYEIM